MNIRHTITYTQYSAERQAHIENTATLYRSFLLTTSGAQRILRRDGANQAIVTRIDTAIVA